jgi:hypothetical protein
MYIYICSHTILICIYKHIFMCILGMKNDNIYYTNAEDNLGAYLYHLNVYICSYTYIYICINDIDKCIHMNIHI